VMGDVLDTDVFGPWIINDDCSARKRLHPGGAVARRQQFPFFPIATSIAGGRDL